MRMKFPVRAWASPRKPGNQDMKTKESGIVEELKAKHKKRLACAQQELKRTMVKPGKRLDHYYASDILLFYKWAYRVGKGWYGFNLGNVPRVWTDVLDEFLCWLETQCQDFEIHQVKMKLGGLRIYLGTKTDLVIRDEEIRSEICQLQNLLRLPACPPAPIRAARKKRRKHSLKP
jgi:hypothetical protein